MLNRDDELRLFRKICGKNKVVTSNHVNCMNDNTPKAGFFNQGVAKAKLRDFVETNNFDFSSWKNK